MSFVEGRALHEIRPSRDEATGRVMVVHETFDRFRQVILPPVIVITVVSLVTILEAFFFIY